MVQLQKGLIAFVKKELNHLSLDPSDSIICRCIIHQESLSAVVVAQCSANSRFVRTVG